MGEETRDRFLGGRIVLSQPRDGYRFSIDAVILAHLALPADGDRVLDLGTGCGIIPIMLACRHHGVHLTGVEIQPALADVARRNVAANGMDGRIRIIEKDMRALSAAEIAGPVDVVVSNPPYRQRSSGRINNNIQKAVARHELSIDLPALVAVARRMLRKGGKMAIVYPSVRTVDLLTAMRGAGIEPKQLTPVQSRQGAPSRLVAVVGTHGGGNGLDIMPPLIIYNDDGTYTRNLSAMLDG